MSATDIFNKAQPKYNIQPFNLAMPRIPTASQVYLPYNNKQNQPNPSDYVVNALKILPINAQYLSNPTNGFAYSSLADVVLNKEAWKKRWGADSWLMTPLGYLPRVLADTGLLLKDTIIDPVIGSVKLANADSKDDLGLFKGLQAGINTAILNTLMNAGYTLDTIANPVKGYIVDGSEGLKKAIVGDSITGRKNYDMGEYIDFGKGFSAGAGEFLTSIALEFVLDPVNWFTWGTSGAAKGVGKGVAKGVVSSIDDVLTGAAKLGKTVSDDIATEIVKRSGNKIPKEVAEQILKEVSDDSGKIVAEAVTNYVDNVEDLLTKTVTNTIKQNPGKKFNSALDDISKEFNTGKSTRFKAGLINKKEYTPTVQKSASALLNNLDITKLPNTSALSTVRNLRRFSNILDGTLNTAALYGTGLGELGLVKKGVDWLGGKINNTHVKQFIRHMAEHPEQVRDLVKKLNANYNIDYEALIKEIDLTDVPGYKNITPQVFEKISKELDILFDDFNAALLESWTHKTKAAARKVLVAKQQEILDKLNTLIADNLSDVNLNTFDEYVEYVHQLYRTSTDTQQLKLLDDKLLNLKKYLNEDLTDPYTLELYISGGLASDLALRDIEKVYKSTQEVSMTDYAERLRAYRKQQNLEYSVAAKDIDDKLNDTALDEAIDFINQNEDALIKQVPEVLNKLKSKDYVGTSQVFGPADKEVVENNITLDDAYKKFLEYSEEYNKAMTDDDYIVDLQQLKYKYVTSYNYLQEKLQQLTTFPKNINASAASETYNDLGEAAIKYARKDNKDVIVQLDNSYSEIVNRFPNLFKIIYTVPATERATMTVEDYMNNIASLVLDGKLSNETATKAYVEVIQFFAEFEKANAAKKRWYDGVLKSPIEAIYSDKFSKNNRIERVVYNESSVLNNTITHTVDGKEISEAIGDYIRNLPKFDNIAEPYTKTIDIEKFVEARLVSYQMQFSQTRFYLDLIKQSTVTTPVEENVNVVDIIFTGVKNKNSFETITQNLNDVDVPAYVQEITGKTAWDADLVQHIYNAVNKTLENKSKQYPYKHLGHSDFEYGKFTPIKNGKYTKPTGGLWLSPKDSTMSWEDFVKSEQFHPEKYLTNSFDMRLSNNAYVYEVTTQEELIDLLTDYGYIEDGRVCINFETLAKDFDAFKVSGEALKSEVFEGWDIDSLLVLNPDVVEAFDDTIKTHTIKKILEPFNSVRIVNQSVVNNSPLMEAVKLSQDTTSDLYKFLNATEFKDLAVVQGVRNTLQRLQDFQTIINKCTVLMDNWNLNAVQREGLIDQIVSQIRLDHKFKINQLDNIATEMINGMNLYYRTHMDVTSFAMDNQIQQAAKRVLKSRANANKKAIAQELLDSLNKTHSAEVDNDNLWRYIQLDDDLNKIVKKSAGSKYRVIFDTETTGDAKDKSTKVFQFAAKIIDETGNEVKQINYIINPGNEKPSYSLLKKLAPEGTIDLDKWWTEEIINKATVTDMNEAMDLFYTELMSLDTSKGFKFIGQNIEQFDIPLLKRYASVDFIKLLDDSGNSIDTLSYMLRKNTPEFTGAQHADLVQDLVKVLVELKNNNNTALTRPLIHWTDMQELSEVKRMIHEYYTGADSLTKPKRSKYNIKGIDDKRIELNTPKSISEKLTPIVNTQDIEVLEEAINYLNESWSSFRKIKSSSLTYTLSKAAITSEATKEIIDEFIAKGIINVPHGTNIMTYVNKYVPAAQVFLNPKTTSSWLLIDVFDIKKVKEVYQNAAPAELIETLTHVRNKIMHHATYLTDDVVQELYPDAVQFLKRLQDARDSLRNEVSLNASVDYLYDFSEDNAKTVVATAIYYNSLRGNDALETFTDVVCNRRGKIGHTKTAQGSKPLAFENVDEVLTTKLGYETHVNKPKSLYDDSNLYDRVECVNAQDYNPLDIIKEYNVDRHIFNAHEAALNNYHKQDGDLAVRVENHLRTLGEVKRFEMERAIRKYNSSLCEAAKNELLNRENRVEALLAEAKLRMGRVAFTDTRELDLSDFQKAGVFVHRTAVTNEAGNIVYIYKLGLPHDAFKNAIDIDLPVVMLKNTAGLDAPTYTFIKEARTLQGQRIHNIGLSQGDVVTEELIKDFDSDLPQEILSKLISIEELKSADMFNKLRANHTFLWDNTLKESTQNYITTDPFKQMFYNTERFVKTQDGMLAAFISLLYNEANSINSPLFDATKINDVDLVKLFKKSDMVVVYLQPGVNIWSRTKVGTKGASYQLKQIKIIDTKSIELARELDAHVIPRTQYLQMAYAINTYELPNIAKYAHLISTVFKLGYITSIGFIVRNLLDSNYKNHIALEGTVSLPEQVTGLFTTIKLLQRYNEIGQNYTKHVGHYFKSDLEYSVFMNICENINHSDIVNTVVEKYPKHLQRQAKRYSDNILTAFKNNTSVLQDLNKVLLDKDMFSIIDSFVQHGPSAGLSSSVLKNIATKKNTDSFYDACTNLVNWITKDSPLRFIYNQNEMVEQSARLYLFIKRIEAGDSIDNAIRTVIKTHFDYSDKSLSDIYLETVFPFMSFSFKNLEFWIESVHKNPALLRELENVLQPCLNFQSLYEPDQDTYSNFDYSFDWSKDVMSFEARAPWQLINASRLYHILSGNIVIDTDKTVRYDNGYGKKDNELLAVFKLSPSVLDAVRMLYNPIDTYQQRLLPPYEVLSNTLINVLNGEAPIEDLGINTLLNNLPFVGATLQRAGYDKPNNINRRIQDAGLPMAISSLFTAAYVPKKDKYYWYDEDYKTLNPTPHQTYYSSPYYTSGGFTPNYSTRRNYSNPYNSRVPTYTINKLARRTPNKALYARSTRYSLKNNYSTLLKNGVQDNLIRKRVLDKFRYFN